ncbi:MAG: excalibur calcium-binding domain-containing protein [Dermatophilaceae bacterium]
MDTRSTLLAAFAAAAVVVMGPVTDASAASATWKNCTAVNQKYPHGVGTTNARDVTTGRPVTTFTRSDKTYAEAIRANRGLDRDKDKIACEKR